MFWNGIRKDMPPKQRQRKSGAGRSESATSVSYTGWQFGVPPGMRIIHDPAQKGNQWTLRDDSGIGVTIRGWSNIKEAYPGLIKESFTDLVPRGNVMPKRTRTRAGVSSRAVVPRAEVPVPRPRISAGRGMRMMARDSLELASLGRDGRRPGWREVENAGPSTSSSDVEEVVIPARSARAKKRLERQLGYSNPGPSANIATLTPADGDAVARAMVANTAAKRVTGAPKAKQAIHNVNTGRLSTDPVGALYAARIPGPDVDEEVEMADILQNVYDAGTEYMDDEDYIGMMAEELVKLPNAADVGKFVPFNQGGSFEDYIKDLNLRSNRRRGEKISNKDYVDSLVNKWARWEPYEEGFGERWLHNIPMQYSGMGSKFEWYNTETGKTLKKGEQISGVAPTIIDGSITKPGSTGFWVYRLKRRVNDPYLAGNEIPISHTRGGPAITNPDNPAAATERTEDTPAWPTYQDPESYGEVTKVKPRNRKEKLYVVPSNYVLEASTEPTLADMSRDNLEVFDPDTGRMGMVEYPYTGNYDNISTLTTEQAESKVVGPGGGTTKMVFGYGPGFKPDEGDTYVSRGGAFAVHKPSKTGRTKVRRGKYEDVDSIPFRKVISKNPAYNIRRKAASSAFRHNMQAVPSGTLNASDLEVYFV